PALVDYARLALDRVPGQQIDTLYLNALSSTSGRTGLGIINSVGTRSIYAAVPALAVLLNDTDAATAAAAARALGQIGGGTAVQALAKSEHALDPVVLNARLAAAATADPATAAQVAGEVYRNPAAPLPQRSAALRGLIAANPKNAATEIHAVLAGNEPALQAVAIEAMGAQPDAASFASRLAGYSPQVQIPLIAALGTRGDAAAIPGLLDAVERADPDVRLAALAALGRLPGTPDLAAKLVAIAAGKGDLAQAAQASLTRLNGPAVDEFILSSARTETDPAGRSVFIQQLAARNQTEAISFLFGLRRSSDDAARLEALDALRVIAAPADQQPIIAWALAAPKAEQSRAIRALITIILRDGNISARATPVINAIRLGDSAARVALLPVLSRVAGADALASAASLAKDADESVARAATAELARWPDPAALPALVDVATNTSSETVRQAAIQGAARFLAQTSAVTPTQRSAQTRALLDLPAEPAARLTLINLLSLCSDEDALAAAKRFLSDPATATAAQDAVDAITSTLAGAPAFTASGSSDTTASASDGKLNTYWAVPCAPGAWLRADLHHSRPVRKLTLEQGGRQWDFPVSAEIQVSNDPDQPGAVLAQIEGERYRTVVTLPAETRGRYLWIRQTGTRSGSWSIAELLVE
ncbi:MAG TPA: HEAT repeat domain-containing protein, partial [Lacunisphaera sp.]|nr:HEAT repeat domain-containing protein [Lacunisphaera sp.]